MIKISINLMEPQSDVSQPTIEDGTLSALPTTVLVPIVAMTNINLAGLMVSIKLTRDNFLLWKIVLLPLLLVYQLTNLLHQDSPMISSLNEKSQACPNLAYHGWCIQDKVVLSIITSSLSESTMSLAVGNETTKETWEAINKQYAARTRSRVMEIQTRLHNFRKGNQPRDTYIQTIQNLGDEIQSCVGKMAEEDLTFALIQGLPPPYNAFYANTSPLLDSLTFDDVVSNLCTYESHLL